MGARERRDVSVCRRHGRVCRCRASSVWGQAGKWLATDPGRTRVGAGSGVSLGAAHEPVGQRPPGCARPAVLEFDAAFVERRPDAAPWPYSRSARALYRDRRRRRSSFGSSRRTHLRARCRLPATSTTGSRRRCSAKAASGSCVCRSRPACTTTRSDPRTATGSCRHRPPGGETMAWAGMSRCWW